MKHIHVSNQQGKGKKFVYVYTCVSVRNLDSKNSVLLPWHKFGFNGVIGVIQVEAFKVNVCKSFNKINPAVVAEKLRLTKGVWHHLSSKGVMGKQNLGQGILENPGHGFKGEVVGGLLVTEKDTHVQRGKKQVEVG
jgi:hypothetical protein